MYLRSVDWFRKLLCRQGEVDLAGAGHANQTMVLSRLLLIAWSMLLVEPSFSFAELSGAVERIEGFEVSVENLQWVLRQDSDSMTSFQATAARARVLGWSQTLENLQLHCKAVVVEPDQLSCHGGLASMRLGVDGPRIVLSDLMVSQISPSDRLTVSGQLRIDQIEARIKLEIDADRITVTFQQLSAPLPLLAQLWAGQLPFTVQEGALNGQGSLSLVDGNFELHLDFSIVNAAFDSADGLLAGADLAIDGSLQLESNSVATVIELNTATTAGEFLAGNLYLDFNQSPTLTVALAGKMDDQGDLIISSFSAHDGDGLTLVGSARIDLDQGALTELDLSRIDLQLDRAYARYFEAVVAAMGHAGLLLSGALSGQVKLRVSPQQGASLEIQSLDFILDDLWIVDHADRFGLEQLSGELHMAAAGQHEDSNLSWQAARVYQINFGQADVHFRLSPNGLVLSSPIELAILDGSLRVDEFGFSVGAEGLETFEFSGAVGPVSLAQFSEALGWPPMEGSFSGEIPKVSLDQGVVAVGGAIVFEVFDGLVTLDQIKMERLFGVLPTLAANIVIDNLDLQQMTSVFSFGRIEGRLSGEVAGLRMLDWEPVAFDLDLHTDNRLKARRRISQRAVENLSNIGGGAAALSQTFLRVFDDFSYQKLGLRCRLRNNVCTMGGVEPAARGYYIVKGSGIPRIDIIGYSSQVDWPQLLHRLDAATRSGGATID